VEDWRRRYEPNCCFLTAKDVVEQIGYSVRNPGLVEEVTAGRHEDPKSNDAVHLRAISVWSPFSSLAISSRTLFAMARCSDAACPSVTTFEVMGSLKGKQVE